MPVRESGAPARKQMKKPLILLLAVVGYALNRGFIAIEKRLLFWYSAEARAAA